MISLFKIAICDDNIEELEQTASYLREYGSQLPDMDIDAKTFSTGFSLLDAIELGSKFDIYILDIVMPSMNGIDLGKEIRKADNNAPIILLTTSKDYGVESYQISAKDYI